jgi:hypothetical protein
MSNEVGHQCTPADRSFQRQEDFSHYFRFHISLFIFFFSIVTIMSDYEDQGTQKETRYSDGEIWFIAKRAKDSAH